MTAKSKTAKRQAPAAPERGKFIEIVNWRKAQYRMKAGGGNDWLKLYTSLLEHDGFGAMDDSARMLIIALWLYAARSGLHVLPADPAWLARRIPMLNGPPDLGPLLNAADVYGNPTPFVRYCKPPKARKGRSARPAAKAGKKGKKLRERADGTKVATRGRTRRAQEKSRVEESRREEEREEQTKPLRVSEEESRERKERISTAEQTEQQRQQMTEEPEKPENPTESEAGSAKRHIMPKPARSAFRRGKPQSIRAVISQWLPEHWQDSDAEAFGWEIVRALGYSDDPNNLKARSEWGAFASWWCKVKKAVPAMALDELWAIAIGKAEYLRTKGKSAKNRSAVWFHIMAGELNKRGVTINHPARASPLP